MNTLTAKCSYCGYEEEFALSKEEHETLLLYKEYGRQLGKIQDLFPRIPAWIRSGAIDKYSEVLSRFLRKFPYPYPNLQRP